MDSSIIEIFLLFTGVAYFFIIYFLTVTKISKPIIKRNPELYTEGIQSPFFVIGLYAVFFKGSDAYQVAKELGLLPTLCLVKILWLPFPVLFATLFITFLQPI